MHDPGRVRVPQCVRDLRADVRYSSPGKASVPADLGTQGRPGDELHHEPRRSIALHYIVDRDHAWMAKPRDRLCLPHSAGNQLSALRRRQLWRQQDLLDCHHTVQDLIAPAPYAPQAALPNRLVQKVSATHQIPRLTRAGK